VLPSTVASFIVAAFTLLATGSFIILVPIAVNRLVRRRPAGRLVIRSIAIALGLILGYFALLGNRWPGVGLLSITVALVVVGSLLLKGMPRTAGAMIVALAGPSVVYLGSFLVDNVVAGQRWLLTDVAPPFVIALVALVAGLSAVVTGDKTEANLHPPSTQLAGRKYGAVGRLAYGPFIFGLPMSVNDLVWSIGILATGWVSSVLVHGRPFGEGLAIVAGATLLAWLVGCLLWTVARVPRYRRAFEAFSWLGEHELDRWTALTGGPAVPGPRDFRRWMLATPESAENRWMRSDILAFEGRLDEARTVALAIPDDAPSDRVERESLLAMIDWLEGGPGDAAAVRSAADAIQPPDGDERLRAEVAVAMTETRHRLGTGDPDAIEPMLAVRDRLGSRADGQLRRVIRRRLWPAILRIALLVVPGFAIVDRLTTFG
jgi:hypothetical protein